MKICAIDFETANNNRASACSLAVIEYIEGEIIEHYWLIKPHVSCREFIFTYIHGLTYDDVCEEKEFNELYSEINKILEGSLVIAHNNMFDVGVLRALCRLYKLPQITFISVDTLEVSRKIFRNLCNFFDFIYGEINFVSSKVAGKLYTGKVIRRELEKDFFVAVIG